MNRSKKNLMFTFAMLVVGSFAFNAQATYTHTPEPEDCCDGKIELFFEDFEGYSYQTIEHDGYFNWNTYKWVSGWTEYVDFPDEKPNDDPVRFGIPTQGDGSLGGAKEKWYATDLGSYNGPLLEDVAVQRRGGGTNNTHTGRVGDHAGLLFSVDAAGYENLTLTFDWRTFAAESGDNIKVYYMIGGIEDPNNDGIVDVDLDDWTKILRDRDNDWDNFCYDFGAEADGQIISVLFSMDGSYDDDYAKFDNVKLCGDETPMDTPEVPAPAALPAGLALLGLAMARRNRKNG